jgi:hypothetical protein
VRASSRLPVLLSLATLFALGACIASAPEGLSRHTDGPGGGGGSFNFGGFGTDDPPDAQTGDPHAVVGAEPSHGPFNGGQRVLVRGRGFSSKVRVWFGDVEVPAASVISIDPSRVQVTAPEGSAGPADITAQNGADESTRRTLVAGYAYDALYASPNSGPVQGGAVVQIIGQNTDWGPDTDARIDQKPCTSLTVLGPTLLACQVPAGTAGAKTIYVKSGNDTITVLDGFTYQDSTNGYEGGLSGSLLSGQIKVLVYDNYTGNAVPQAHVVIGAPIEQAIVGQTDASGVVVIDDALLVSPQTVTVAARCHSPQTFVGVPVDTVTAYLDPLLTPECAGSGTPPPVGGHYGPAGAISGELVWGTANEFGKGKWINVPHAVGPNERKAAYVFFTGSDPSAAFYKPSTSYAVTEDTPGSQGYGFSLSSGVGNKALYALAGVEDTETGKFTAYAMGTVRGVPVLPDLVTEQVYIRMDTTLDQALVLDVSAPAPGFKGPDRLKATVSVLLGNDGYMILPGGSKEPLLPLQGALSFVGVPPLADSLFGSTYVTSARAVTGPSAGAPMSVVANVRSTSTAQHVTIADFVPVPVLTSPATGSAWDGKHLAAAVGGGGTPVDITVYDVVAGNGVAHWLVAVPAGSNAVELPDLSGFELASLPPGPLTIGVTTGRVKDFDYEVLQYQSLRYSGMTSYALDYFSAHH